MTQLMHLRLRPPKELCGPKMKEGERTSSKSHADVLSMKTRDLMYCLHPSPSTPVTPTLARVPSAVPPQNQLEPDPRTRWSAETTLGPGHGPIHNQPGTRSPQTLEDLALELNRLQGSQIQIPPRGTITSPPRAAYLNHPAQSHPILNFNGAAGSRPMKSALKPTHQLHGSPLQTSRPREAQRLAYKRGKKFTADTLRQAPSTLSSHGGS
jgi:hypothetical protein